MKETDLIDWIDYKLDRLGLESGSLTQWVFLRNKVEIFLGVGFARDSLVQCTNPCPREPNQKPDRSHEPEYIC